MTEHEALRQSLEPFLNGELAYDPRHAAALLLDMLLRHNCHFNFFHADDKVFLSFTCISPRLYMVLVGKDFEDVLFQAARYVYRELK